jgi:hypothetical protein
MADGTMGTTTDTQRQVITIGGSRRLVGEDLEMASSRVHPIEVNVARSVRGKDHSDWDARNDKAAEDERIRTQDVL